MSQRRSTGVAGTLLTAARNVSKTTGTGKAHLCVFVLVFVFVFVFAILFSLDVGKTTIALVFCL